MQSYGIAKSSTFSRIENCYVVMVQDSGLILLSTNNYSVNMNMKLSFLLLTLLADLLSARMKKTAKLTLVILVVFDVDGEDLDTERKNIKVSSDIYGSTIIYKMYIQYIVVLLENLTTILYQTHHR